MRRARKPVRLVVFVVSFTAFCVPMECAAIDFKTIELAWRERERQAETLTLKWSESRVSTPPRSVEKDKQVFQDVPDMAMFVKGRKARLEGRINIQSVGERGERNIGTLGASDARDLFFANSRPFGTILAKPRPAFAGQMNAWPALLLYRGCSKSLLDCTLSVFSKPGTVIREGGATTIKLETSSRHARLSPLHWALTMQDDLNYTPVRLTGTAGGKTRFDLKIELGVPHGSVPIPRSWSVTLFNDRGRLIGTVRAQVTSCAVGGSIDDSLFELRFPEGTIVTDMRPTAAGKRERRFLVLADGERDITEAELLRGAK